MERREKRLFRDFAAWSLALVALAGCASVDPGPAFDAAAKEVRARTGLEAAWPRDEAAAAEVERLVEELLAEPLTADGAARIALLNNRALQAELEELGIAQADYAQATRIANPTFAGSRREPDEGPGDNVELKLAEDVLDLLVQPLRKKLGAVELEAAKLRVGQSMLDVVAEAKVAFTEHQANELLVARLGLVRDLAAAAAELARRQRAAGNVGDLDVAQQEAMEAEAAIDLARAGLEEQITRQRVDVLLGLSGDETSWTAAPRLPELPAADPPLDGLEERALAERLDLGAARFGVDLVGRALALKKGTRFFPAGIEVGVEREDELDGVRLTGPRLAIELPIFDTGAASIARLESERRRAERQLEQLTLEVRAEVRLARERLLAARELTESYRDTLLPQRARILDQTLRHYNMMLLGVYDLLLARRQEVESEKAYVASWRDYWIARAQLERAIGGPLEPGLGTNAASTLPEATAHPSYPKEQPAPTPAHDHSSSGGQP